MSTIDPQRIENLSAADRMINALLTYADHVFHGRPGIVTPAPGTPVGVTWEASTYKEEGETTKQKVAYFCRKVGKKNTQVRAGTLGAGGRVTEGGRVIGEYRQPGFFPEVAAWMYRQIAEIYKLDNEFVARWASYAFAQEHRDLKVALCAFMLVQNRKGDPIREGDKILFADEDYRDVGEAMCLLKRTDKRDFKPKELLRVGDFLKLPVIAQINRELGFSSSMKNPTVGRWDRAVEKYLRHREANPKILEGLVKEGYRTTVMALAQKIHYKATSARFYQTLRWKQAQAADGRRSIAIGADVSAAESWEGLSEADVCQRIIATRPSYKRIVGMLPASIGLTRAIVAASVQAGSLSNQDLIILTPTLEELGLTGEEPVKSRWETAIRLAENQRAANIASRVKTVEVKAALEEAADNAMKKAVAEVVKGLNIYFMVDISGSMSGAIDQAKVYVTQILGGVPLDKVHVSVFNSSGREVKIKHASKAGVEAAFMGISANGGTDYGAGVRALQHFKPSADEDALFIFVGDEQHSGADFAQAVTQSGLNPTAFGLIKVGGSESDRGVRNTAARLGIPCFNLDTKIFSDVYAIPRALRNLISSTPVSQNKTATPAVQRVSLIEQILKTDMLVKPAWAS